MALQFCPKCKKESFTWYIDEDETPLTQWYCYECGYHALEDEEKLKHCSICGLRCVSELQDLEGRYWWCSNCGKIDLIERK